MPPLQCVKLESKLHTIVGSLNWILTQTRPDIATITNMIVQYQTDAAKYVLWYLKGTSTLGITFSSHHNTTLASFVKFPISDANWGSQDASIPKSTNPIQEIELFKSRSISGFLIWLGGPLHWISKRQTITTHSSAEAEIYAIDECTKCF